MKPLFVGEAPSRLGDPHAPLTGKIGRRLAELSGLSEEEFMRRTWRVNLLHAWPGSAGKGSLFPIRPAILTADALLMQVKPPQKIVLLGLRVASAFGMQEVGYLKWGRTERVRCIVIPYPSGVNRWYNSTRNKAKLRKFLTALLKEQR